MALYKAKVASFQWLSIYQSQIMTEVVLRNLMGHNSSMSASCLKFIEHYEHLDDNEKDLLSREVEDVSSPLINAHKAHVVYWYLRDHANINIC